MGKEYNIKDLASELADMGYERYGIVEGTGQFSVRGGILDVFTPESENPVRIEFFGDEVDSIRSFDRETQRSLKNLKEIDIYPAREISGDGVFEKGSKNSLRNTRNTQTAFQGRKRILT